MDKLDELLEIVAHGTYSDEFNRLLDYFTDNYINVPMDPHYYSYYNEGQFYYYSPSVEKFLLTTQGSDGIIDILNELVNLSKDPQNGVQIENAVDLRHHLMPISSMIKDNIEDLDPTAPFLWEFGGLRYSGHCKMDAVEYFEKKRNDIPLNILIAFAEQAVLVDLH